ncbi:MAG: DUF4129 domain-containing protein [Chloroflexi bacterium]|nr:DUF4129 domain-containing protein [Chloroflexota bacterium]
MTSVEPDRVPRPPSHRQILRAAQIILALSAEAGWLFAWSAAPGGWLDPPAPVLALPALAGILAVAALATKLDRRLPSPETAQTALPLIGLLVAAGVALLTWATLPAVGGRGAPVEASAPILDIRVLEATALALLAWWRGLTMGGTPLTAERAEAALRLAVGALFGLFLVDLTVSARPPGSASPLVGAALVVLCSGLVGLPLARVLDLAESPRHRAEPRLGVGGHWLVMLLAAVAILLVAALVLTSVATFERLDTLLLALSRPLVTVLTIVLLIVAVPAGLLIELMVELIRSILRLEPLPPPPPKSDNGLLEELLRQAERSDPPQLLMAIIAWTSLGLFAALVAYLIARAIRRNAAAATDDDVPELRDFVWSGLPWRDALRRRLHSLLDRLRRGTTLRSRRTARAHRSAWGPREIYRELLALGARLGRRRAVPETPHEYERALAELPSLAGGRAELRAITETYVQARYAADQPSPATVTTAREALHSLTELSQRQPDVETR